MATLHNNTWTYNVVKPQGAICADGNFADIVIRYAIDNNTLAGIVTADSNGECPGGQVTQAPIQQPRSARTLLRAFARRACALGHAQTALTGTDSAGACVPVSSFSSSSQFRLSGGCGLGAAGCGAGSAAAGAAAAFLAPGRRAPAAIPRP